MKPCLSSAPLGQGSSERDRRQPPELSLVVAASSPAWWETAPIASSGPCLSHQPDFQGTTLVLPAPPEALDLIFSAAQHSNAAIKEMVSSSALRAPGDPLPPPSCGSQPPQPTQVSVSAHLLSLIPSPTHPLSHEVVGPPAVTEGTPPLPLRIPRSGYRTCGRCTSAWAWKTT